MLNEELCVPLDGNVIGVNPIRGREPIRRLLHRSMVCPADLVMPLLVQRDVANQHALWTPLPVVTVERLPHEARTLHQLGIRGVMVFAVAAHKDAQASSALLKNNPMISAIKALKDSVPELCVMAETCLCAYTESGNCVLLNADGSVDRQGTCEVLAEMAGLQVQAGADILGVSSMLDSSVRTVRAAIDAESAPAVGVMAHIIFNSRLYGLYRKTMRATPRQGHRGAFQLDFSQPSQAIDQAMRFLAEGADILLLEPALPVIDVLVALRSAVYCPLAAFSVSGEYQMLNGLVNTALYEGCAIAVEWLSALKRAGADVILTYAAKDIARELQGVGIGSVPTNTA
jgi:porphobilinogen synthase